MQTIKEGSSAFFTFVLTDENGDPQVPSTVAWRLDDVGLAGALTEIADWTVLTPASTINLTVPGANNDILDATKIVEHKLLALRTNVGLATEANATELYRVRNLKNIP